MTKVLANILLVLIDLQYTSSWADVSQKQINAQSEQ